MLVIRRRVGQTILIGDGIEIKVLEAGPNRVKLGISAPGDVAVQRPEALLTRDENVTAASGMTGRGIEQLVRIFRRGPKSTS